MLRSHLALFAVNLLYGINYVLAKGLMPGHIGANAFILLRVTGASLLFWTLLSFNRQKIAKADLGRLMLCGLFGVGINQLFFFNGLMLTSPVNASIIMVTTPILVLLLSLIFVKEKIRLIQITGVVIGAIAAVIFSMQQNSGGFATGLGDLFILLNALSYGIYLVLVKPLMAKYNALTVITWVFSFGLVVVFIWPFTWIEFGQTNFGGWNALIWMKVAFVIVGVTFMPYLLMVYAMKNVSPTIASVYIYIQPVLATAFIYLFYVLGIEDYTRDLSLIKLVCTLFIFLGVYLVIMPPQKSAHT